MHHTSCIIHCVMACNIIHTLVTSCCLCVVHPASHCSRPSLTSRSVCSIPLLTFPRSHLMHGVCLASHMNQLHLTSANLPIMHSILPCYHLAILIAVSPSCVLHLSTLHLAYCSVHRTSRTQYFSHTAHMHHTSRISQLAQCRPVLGSLII